MRTNNRVVPEGKGKGKGKADIMDQAKRMGPGAPQTLREVLERIDQTRQRGHATVFDAYEQGTSAMAAVVCASTHGAPIATVSIAGPSVRMTPERREALAPDLLACAKALGATSGQSPLFASVN